MAILSKACKTDKFELHNSPKLGFTNIRGLRSNFVDCESLLQSNSPEILALCETNLDDSVDSGNFSMRGYLSLIRKDSSTHMHGLTDYVEEGLTFAQDLSLEKSADAYLYFRLALLHSVSYIFSLYRSSSSSLCTVFDSISSKIDEVLSIKPSANVFETLTFIKRAGLPILVELINLVNTVIVFLSQMTLPRWSTFLLGFQTVIFIVMLFEIISFF